MLNGCSTTSLLDRRDSIGELIRSQTRSQTRTERNLPSFPTLASPWVGDRPGITPGKCLQFNITVREFERISGKVFFIEGFAVPIILRINHDLR